MPPIESSKSQLSRIARGLGASWLGQGASVLSRLLEIPIVISYWGIELYGVWLVINVIPAILTSSDFGIGAVTSRMMAREINDDRQAETLITYQTSLLISVGSAAVFSFLTIVLFYSGLAQHLLGLRDVPLDMTLSVASLLCIRVVFLMISRVSQAGLFCVGRYPEGILISGIGEFGALIAFFFAIFFGGELVSAAILQLIATFVVVIFMQRSVKRHAPWLVLGLSNARFTKLREMSSPALATFALTIARSINYSLPRIIVSAYGGPPAATIFHAHRQLARFINFMLLFARPFQAEIAISYKKDVSPEFRELSLFTVQLFIYISIASTIIVVGAAVMLFPLWTDGRISLDPTLFMLLTGTTFAESIVTCVLIVLEGINRHQFISRVYLILNIVVMPFAIVFIHLLGNVGMALCLLAIDVTSCVIALPQLSKVLDISTVSVLTRTFSPPQRMIRLARNLFK